MGHAIGIDVGTTNAKVALVADDGRLVATATRPIPSRRAGEVAEQDPDALWQAVVDGVRTVTSAAPRAAADVAAIGVCSQYSSIVPVDADGATTADLVLYLDRRGTAESWAIMGQHPEAFATWVERHGVPPVGGGLSLAHILHFQTDRPEVHAATAAYLEAMDFVNLRLTGRAVATQCTMFLVQLCDNRTLGVTRYDDELVRMAGVDAAKLPPLIPVDGVVGPLRPDIARELGLPARAVVYAGMNDSQAAAFATGAFRERWGGVVIGTTAVLLDDMAHYANDLDHQLVSMPSPVEGKYLAWAENGIAGKAVEHVLEHVVYAADALGNHASDDQFAALDAALASVPAGSSGVLFLPWLNGSLAPKSSGSMRGGFLNLSLDVGRLDLVRAMVEGTAHNLRWLLPHVEAFTGQRMEELVFGGGAARARGWAQILADVLDRPVHVLASPGTAVARAVGLVALHRHGALGTADVAGMAETCATCVPTPAHRDRYDRMHEQFVAAFEALRPIYEALNA
jgi:xylulokinase